MKPQQPGGNAQVLRPARQGRDKVVRLAGSGRTKNLSLHSRMLTIDSACRWIKKGSLRVSVGTESEARTVVLKVGGSVLTGVKAYRHVAAYLKKRSEIAPRERLVVVVSAQKLLTTSLERRAHNILRRPSARALDLLWATGELRSVALLTLHLEAIGVQAVGLNVHETGLRLLDEAEPHRRRPAVRGLQLDRALAAFAVVVVPGFLAVRPDQAMVTLGRGGSDLSAVLLALELGNCRCELVKDVPGYFERDPRTHTSARHLSALSFEEALQMAKDGCDLVQAEALGAAAEASLPLIVRSLDGRAPSTVVGAPRTEGQPEPEGEMTREGSCG